MLFLFTLKCVFLLLPSEAEHRNVKSQSHKGERGWNARSISAFLFRTMYREFKQPQNSINLHGGILRCVKLLMVCKALRSWPQASLCFHSLQFETIHVRHDLCYKTVLNTSKASIKITEHQTLLKRTEIWLFLYADLGKQTISLGFLRFPNFDGTQTLRYSISAGFLSN